MEGLTPSLKCLIEIQSAIRNGEPARVGALRFLQHAGSREPFAHSVRQVIFSWDQGQDWRFHLTVIRSPQRRALIELMIASFGGQTILPHLEDLQQEMLRACEIEMKQFMDMLPIKMLVPLLLLQFPAFLLLLFGPLVSRFVEELSR